MGGRRGAGPPPPRPDTPQPVHPSTLAPRGVQPRPLTGEGAPVVPIEAMLRPQ